MIFRWSGSCLVESAEPPSAVDVADSWLVDDGRVAQWERHRNRFLGNIPGAESFLAHVPGCVPGVGRWFPRIEAHGAELYLRVRPAQTLREDTVLWVPPGPEQRERPLVKGPDLEWCAQLRAQAHALGADDALLWTDDGLVAEAAHSALAWEENGRMMFARHPRQLPSVTAAATRALVPGWGAREVTVGELVDLPVWAGNALHGWTPVMGWVTAGGEQREATATPAQATTRRLNRLIGR
ncbi:Aminotransferase class IV [Corynebacterium atrinae]|uniref:aminotransferase class IV n=1 Tax=Corynebacterium atrinae TaxID=1336740 RepID=UPI0025B36259|nr:aminotransferase class IV [Corynebacterium atrinae]WJY62933.1 Aminotransferase class IV [Corynebacterium atrinae]